MGIVLLIIIAASVIALICITQKRKALEKDFSAASDTLVTSGSASTGHAGHQEKNSDSQQNTIYKFSSKTVKSVCPFCDGENRVGAKVCNICGRNI